MEEQENYFHESRKKLEAYINERVLLLKLQALEKMSRLGASLFTAVVLAMLAFFILLFLSLMAGYYFAMLTDSMFGGFGIVTAFYVLLFLVLLKFKKNMIEKHITNMIITSFFDKEEKKHHDNTTASSTE